MNMSHHEVSKDTINVIEEALQPRQDYYGVTDWGDCIERIIENLERIVSEFNGDYSCWNLQTLSNSREELLSETKKTKLMKTLQDIPKSGSRGILSDSPITSLLSELRKRPEELVEASYTITAHIIHAAKWWRDEILRDKSADYNNQKNKKLYKDRYKPNLEAACRSVRLISNEAMKNIAFDIFDTTQIYRKLEETTEQNKYENFLEENDASYVKNIERFLAFSYAARSPHEGPLKRKNRKASNVFEEKLKFEFVLSGLNASPTIISREICYGTSDREKINHIEQNLKSTGLAITEEISNIEYQRESQPLKTKKGDTTLQSTFRTQLADKHIKKNAQLIPFRWDQLSSYEIRKLWESVLSQHNPHATTVICLMLITGRPLESIINTRVVRKRTHLPKRINENDIFIIVEDNSWASGIIEPESRRQLNSNWKDNFETTVEKSSFKIPIEIWRLMSSSTKKASDRSHKRSSGLFNENRQKTLEENVKKIVSATNKKFKTRLTLHRITNTLFHQTVFSSGDIAEASLITGTLPATGSISSLYYYTPRIDHLCKVYENVMKRIQDAAIGSSPEQLDFLDESREKERVGSPITPKESYIFEVAKDLYQRCMNEKMKTYDPQFIVRTHNALTLYTAMLIMFSTGYRSIKDPLSDLSHINIRRKTVVISDKVDDNLTNSRLVPATGLLVDQVNHYVEHCNFLKERLSIIFDKNTSRPLFFLSRNMEPQRVTPERLQRHLSLETKPPLNMNRHYLRTRLRELEVPGEYVDTFMGHWGCDQVPYSRFSTFCTHQYLSTTRAAIETLLERSQWKVARGFS